MSDKRIYMDYGSTTPLDPRVFKAMLPYFSEKFGNPSSIHIEGTEAKKAVNRCRKSVAFDLGSRADEIIFTSGGTESNNLAILGAVRALEKKGLSVSKMRFITTAIEHSSVLECFRELESRGAKVDYAPVPENGIVEAKIIMKLLRPETVLVSVQYANNEIGAIQPIREISKLLRNFLSVKGQRPAVKGLAKPIFHCDASQAPLYLDCAVERLGIDLLTLDGHKIYGPKGIGMLYVKRGASLSPIIFGGGQEGGLRSTTENVPAIVGFTEALRIAGAGREKESARLKKLRDYFYSLIRANGPTKGGILINGDLKNRLPNNINISIPGIDTEFALFQLDAAGIACSTKSSCLGSGGGSYVVRALGTAKPYSKKFVTEIEARAMSTLRFTFGRDTSKKDIDRLLSTLAKIVAVS